MIKVQKIFVMAALVLIPSVSFAQKVNILTGKTASNREQYAAEYLQKKLNRLGFSAVVNGKEGEYRISLSQAKDTAGLKKEGFSWTRKGKKILLQGNDGSGVIYGCNEIVEYVAQHGSLNVPQKQVDAPEWCSVVPVLACRRPFICRVIRFTNTLIPQRISLGSMTRNSGFSILICS